MEKKKLLFTIFLTVIIILICVQIISRPQWSINNVKKIEMTIMPSPPQRKEITEKEDVEKFIQRIKNVNGVRIPCGDIKGWEILVNFYDDNNGITNQITFVGPYMFIDDTCYIVGKKNIDALKTYINQNYIEE